jgi:hypothetical protein
MAILPNGSSSVGQIDLAKKYPLRGGDVSIWCRQPQGTLIRMCGVFIDAYFHGGLNETIRDRVRPRPLEISPFWFEVVLTASGAMTSSEWSFFCQCSPL